ncbi:hypothetical protein HD806DRAFT_541338 [Xylariaceae sp. AK1471]|nr:hypothetical protein HD806DRAFT_541338 [Xylariaceae sp. AK1471]
MEYAAVISLAHNAVQTLAQHESERTAELKTIEVSPINFLNDAFDALYHLTDMVLIDEQALSNEELAAEDDLEITKALDGVKDAYNTALDPSDIGSVSAVVNVLALAQSQANTSIKNNEYIRAQRNVEKSKILSALVEGGEGADLLHQIGPLQKVRQGAMLEISASIARGLELQNACASGHKNLFNVRQSSLTIFGTLADLKAKPHAHLKPTPRRSFADSIMDIIRKTSPSAKLLACAKELLIKFDKMPKTSALRVEFVAEITETQKWVEGQIQALAVTAIS